MPQDSERYQTWLRIIARSMGFPIGQTIQVEGEQYKTMLLGDNGKTLVVKLRRVDQPELCRDVKITLPESEIGEEYRSAI